MNSFVALATLSRKEIVRILRIWIQTLIPPVITMTLYLVIFGSLIGSQVEDMQGFSYMLFIVPGVIMMSVIMNSYTNTSSSLFGNKFQRNLEELLVSPTPNWVLVSGFVAGGMFRGLLVGAIVTIVSFFFTDLQVHSLFYLLVFVFMTSLVFSLAGFTNGLLAKKFDDVTIIPTFILTPLTYFGGVFYSIEMLPAIAQTLSQLNPILYMVNGFRYGFLGVSDIGVLPALVMLAFFAILLFVFNLFLLGRGVGIRT